MDKSAIFLLGEIFGRENRRESGKVGRVVRVLFRFDFCERREGEKTGGSILDCLVFKIG